MSRRSAFSALAACTLVFASGCWEQLDGGKWFPQMKRQIAVQAFEEVGYGGRVEPFSPPEGSVPIGGKTARPSNSTGARPR